MNFKVDSNGAEPHCPYRSNYVPAENRHRLQLATSGEQLAIAPRSIFPYSNTNLKVNSRLFECTSVNLPHFQNIVPVFKSGQTP